MPRMAPTVPTAITAITAITGINQYGTVALVTVAHNGGFSLLPWAGVGLIPNRQLQRGRKWKKKGLSCATEFHWARKYSSIYQVTHVEYHAGNTYWYLGGRFPVS